MCVCFCWEWKQSALHTHTCIDGDGGIDWENVITEIEGGKKLEEILLGRKRVRLEVQRITQTHKRLSHTITPHHACSCISKWSLCDWLLWSHFFNGIWMWQMESFMILKHFRRRTRVSVTGLFVLCTQGGEHCYYQGKVRGVPQSFVALSTCHGLQ